MKITKIIDYLIEIGFEMRYNSNTTEIFNFSYNEHVYIFEVFYESNICYFGKDIKKDCKFKNIKYYFLIDRKEQYNLGDSVSMYFLLDFIKEDMKFILRKNKIKKLLENERNR